MTQEDLYAGLDLDLSWSERDLPERERTKHVHRLHPYLGKFIPQLVEVLLSRYVAPGGRVLDPFAGSGTTLVQALETLEKGVQTVPLQVNPAVAALYIVHPFRGQGIQNLFSTHPPLAERIRRLREYDAAQGIHYAA